MVSTDEEGSDEDESERCHLKITKKKKYFDLIKNIQIKEAENEIENKFPLVRKSVGFKDINLVKSDSVSETSEVVFLLTKNDDKQRPLFPWHLLHAEPTQIERIDNVLVLNKILENELKMKEEKQIKKVKFKQFKLFKQMIRRNLNTKKINKNEELRIYEEMLPEEEFEKLQQKYLEKGLINLNINEQKPFLNNSDENNNRKSRESSLTEQIGHVCQRLSINSDHVRNKINEMYIKIIE